MRFMVMLCVVLGACGSVTTAGTDGAAGSGLGGAGGAAGSSAQAGSGGSTNVGGASGSLAGADGGVAGSGGRGTRPLAAGCTNDGDCQSGICAPTTGDTNACCNGRPNPCGVCAGGYLTAKPDGPTADGCAVCTSGKASNQNEGMLCGAGETCTGSGTNSRGGMITTMANSFACHAGICVTTTTDCTTRMCPSACKPTSYEYVGCFIDSPGSVSAMTDGGMQAVPGAACRCVVDGSFCSAAL